MKIINLKRGQGKTTRLLFASEMQNIPILVVNQMAKQLLMEKAEKYNIKIPEPLTVSDIQNGKCVGTHIDKILVDEIDMVLQAFLNKDCPLTIEVGTITVDE